MTNGQRPLEALHLALWVAQVVLAASFMWAAGIELFQPVSKLAAMWPWLAHVADILGKVYRNCRLIGGNQTHNIITSSHQTKTYGNCSYRNYCTNDCCKCFPYSKRRGISHRGKYSFCSYCSFHSLGQIQQDNNIIKMKLVIKFILNTLSMLTI